MDNDLNLTGLSSCKREFYLTNTHHGNCNDPLCGRCGQKLAHAIEDRKLAILVPSPVAILLSTSATISVFLNPQYLLLLLSVVDTVILQATKL